MDMLAATRAVRARRWLGYLVALLAPCLALAIRLGLGEGLVGYPFLTFFPAVLLTALIGNRGAGATAALLSALLAGYFLVEPLGYALPTTPSDWIGFGFFLTVCGTIILLVGWLNQALDQLGATSRALAQLNAELEQRVECRTRELAEANLKLEAESEARLAAETQARQAQKMEAVGQLTGGIAHDFNNMLAIIIGSLDVARRRLADGRGSIGTYLDLAMEGAQRGAALTQRLLAFSRQTPLTSEITDVNGLIRGMEDLLRRSLGEMVALECVLSGGLWRTRVDQGQLENAILNLVVNARDAMPSGGRLTIETMNAHLDDAYARAHAEVGPGQYVVVAVSDTGEGMPPEVVARAFDPFFTTKPTGKGTGLGLSQVYGFVKQSGGHVKIYSEAGRGTSVKLYLRREMMADVAVSPSPRSEASPIPLGSAGEIILVVEDEDSVRLATVASLRELGYTVRHACSGPEALVLLDAQPGIGLLLTDVVMPSMTGRMLAEAARAKYPDLRVLYATGYTPNAIVHNGVVDPGIELLTKPFTLDQLARKVRKVLA
ncbi:ATP-binding protein [Methylobacterium iners]|nr:ATP-binding protein [Methylobacterium iners]